MVHASRYHDFLEDAFLQWLKDNGMPYASLRERGLDLVMGTTTIRYLLPGRLGDNLEVRARPAGSTTSTVTVGFTIARDSSVLAEGATTYIAVRAGRSAPLPDELRALD
jgi:YbgC/YbaW family acyl-CoA thioester hydrolase